MLNTDKAPTYAGAIAELKAEGKCPNETRHRQVKYLNNVVEADHGKLKLLLRPVRGFKTLKTAYATIKGFEVMRALRKGQARAFALQGGIIGEARIVERAFGVGPCALTEAMALLQDHLAMRRPPVLLDHHTPSSGLQQSPCGTPLLSVSVRDPPTLVHLLDDDAPRGRRIVLVALSRTRQGILPID